MSDEEGEPRGYCTNPDCPEFDIAIPDDGLCPTCGMELGR